MDSVSEIVLVIAIYFSLSLTAISYWYSQLNQFLSEFVSIIDFVQVYHRCARLRCANRRFDRGRNSFLAVFCLYPFQLFTVITLFLCLLRDGIGFYSLCHEQPRFQWIVSRLFTEHCVDML